jgi:hypothetical protein
VRVIGGELGQAPGSSIEREVVTHDPGRDDAEKPTHDDEA